MDGPIATPWGPRCVVVDCHSLAPVRERERRFPQVGMAAISPQRIRISYSRERETLTGGTKERLLVGGGERGYAPHAVGVCLRLCRRRGGFEVKLTK